MNKRPLCLPSLASLASATTLALVLAACGSGGGGGRGGGLCAGVTCPAGQVCSVVNGQCITLGGDDLAMEAVDLATDDGPTKEPDLAREVDASKPADLGVQGDAKPVDLGGGSDGGLLASCNAPIPIPIANNMGSISGDTSAYKHFTDGSCGGASGPDLVYSVTLAAKNQVTFTLTPNAVKSPDFEPVLYLRDVCADKAKEVACHYSGGPAKAASFNVVLPAGTYFLFVDGYIGTKGAFTITVALAPPPPAPANDACGGAQALTFVNGKATASGDLRGAGDDAVSTCGSKGGDAVYTFTTLQAQSFLATLTPDKSTPNYRPVLFLRKVCASAAMADELACTKGAIGGAADITVANLPAGKYWLWADSLDNASGKFTLDATLAGPPPANDTCAAPEKLTFVNNMAAATVETLVAKDDGSGTCGGTSPDAIYTFTTLKDQQITITVAPDMNSAAYQPLVYLRASCAAGELGCIDAGKPGVPAKLVVPFVPAGTYFLWVDGFGGTKGKAALTVLLDVGVPPPPGDSCLVPATLTLMNNTGTAMADTTSLKDDTSGGCGGTGPDQVFKFTTVAAQKITATVKPDPLSPTYQPVVYLRRDNGMGCLKATEAVCKYAAKAGDSVTAVVPNGPADTWYAWVDGYTSTKGKSTLTVTLEMPVPGPANENCTKPTPIALNAMAMGDTTSAFHDMGALISLVCDENGSGDFPGPDLVYVYTPAMNGTATITLKSDGTWDPALWVMPAMCQNDGAKCTAASDLIGNGMAEVLKVAVTANTPYYLVVDAYQGKEVGAFTLTVQ
ncbi:MAG: hypothetical protein EXR72_17510 [Myxococcales bacterium]|nr:hypothetical protein [Myxococcales bacterium]